MINIDYIIYLSVASSLLYDVTNELIAFGISKDRIKYFEDVEYRKGCRHIGTTIRLGASDLATCCFPYFTSIAATGNFDTDLKNYYNFCSEILTNIKTNKPSVCDGCPNLKYGIWPVEYKLHDISLVSGYKYDKCNLNCIYCNAEQDLLNDNEIRISAVEVIGQICKTITYPIELSINNGEISINKDCSKIFNYLLKTDFTVTIFTNAYIYSNDIESFLLSKPNARLLISIDAGTKETFHKVKGLNVNKNVDGYNIVTCNLRKYSLLKNTIVLKYIIIEKTNDNIYDIDMFVQFAYEINAAIIVSQDMANANKRANRDIIMLLLRLINSARQHKLSVNVSISSFNPEDYNTLYNASCGI